MGEDNEGRVPAVSRASLPEWGLLTAVLVVAAVARLWRLDLMEFGADDGLACISGLQILDGNLLRTGLRTSLGYLNPPLFVYLVAAATALSKSAAFVAGCVALTNVAAVGVTWRVGRRCFGPVAGLVAALLMAVSPSAIFASRRVYAQDFVPLFAALILLCVVRVALDGKRRDVFWIVVLTAALAQVHSSGVVLAAALAAIALAVRPRVSWAFALAGVGVALLLYAPYIGYLFGEGSGDVKVILGAGFGGGGESGNRWMAWAYAFDIAGFGDSPYILAFAFKPIMKGLPGALFARYLLNVAVALLLLWRLRDALLWQAIVRWLGFEDPQDAPRGEPTDEDIRSSRLSRVLLLWVFVPVLIYFISGLLVIPSYFYILFPAPFLLAGAGVSRLVADGQRRAVRIAVAAIAVLLVVGYHGAYVAKSYRWFDTEEGMRASYVTYRDQKNVSQYVVDRLSPGATRVCQNYWAPSTGATYNYMYLMYWLRGVGNRVPLYDNNIAEPAADFRIVDMPYLREFPKPPEADKILSKYTQTTFGAVLLYERIIEE